MKAAKQKYLWSILPIILSAILSWEIKDEIWAAPKEPYEYTLDTEKEIRVTYYKNNKEDGLFLDDYPLTEKNILSPDQYTTTEKNNLSLDSYLPTETNGSYLEHYTLAEKNNLTLYVVGPVSLNEKGGISLTLPFTKEIPWQNIENTSTKEKNSPKNINTEEWRSLGSRSISLSRTTPYWKIVNDDNVIGVGTKDLIPPAILDSIPLKSLTPRWHYKIQLESPNTITIHLYMDITTCPPYGFPLHLSEFNLPKDKESKLYFLTNYDFSLPLQLKEDELIFTEESPDILINGFFTLEQTINLIP